MKIYLKFFKNSNNKLLDITSRKFSFNNNNNYNKPEMPNTLNSSYFNQFKSIYRLPIENLSLIDLIQTKEYLKINFHLSQKEWRKAEIILEKVKYYFRKYDLASYNYCVILRRLGICKLKQNKISEGLLELENIYEYSKSREIFEHTFRYNASIDLLKTYIQYDSSKAAYFAGKLVDNEKEIRILDLEQLSEVYHYAGVIIIKSLDSRVCPREKIF